MEQDTIQINAPHFNPDIDGPKLAELADATNFQEKTSDRDQLDTTHNNLEESYGHDNSSQNISSHISVQHSMRQPHNT